MPSPPSRGSAGGWCSPARRKRADLAGRELADAWEAAIEAIRAAAASPRRQSRGRVAFGAPLPAGIAAERGARRYPPDGRSCPRGAFAKRLSGCLPGGWRLVDLFDVWIGAPALAGQVAAADYRIELDGANASGRGAPRSRRCWMPGAAQGRAAKGDVGSSATTSARWSPTSSWRRRNPRSSCAPGRGSTPSAERGGPKKSSLPSRTSPGLRCPWARSCASGCFWRTSWPDARSAQHGRRSVD